MTPNEMQGLASVGLLVILFPLGLLVAYILAAGGRKPQPARRRTTTRRRKR